MVRDTYAYRDVAVQSLADARSGKLLIHPIPGQAFAPSLRVQCPGAMRDAERYPAGTRFLVSAKLTDRLGGTPFLYVHYGDPIVVLSAAGARRFLAEFRRGRI